MAWNRVKDKINSDPIDEKLQRAKNVDLIEMPDDLKERCSNCIYISKEGYCKHPKVKQQIEHPDKACCGLWDNEQVDRKNTQGRE